MNLLKFLVLIFCLPLLGINNIADNPKGKSTAPNKFYRTSKPLARWFWFAAKIKPSDVKFQLDWAKRNQFGGVEIAWVYPLYRYNPIYALISNRQYPMDTSAQEWLSQDWTDIVANTKRYADSIELACDFTFGSACPQLI